MRPSAPPAALVPLGPREHCRQARLIAVQLDQTLSVIYYHSGRTTLLWRRFRTFMPLLPRKGVLAIAAVIDVALQGEGHPISAKTLAARHGLPPRHLEPVLQALVRDGILKGIRGPRGGYELARERRQRDGERHSARGRNRRRNRRAAGGLGTVEQGRAAGLGQCRAWSSASRSAASISTTWRAAPKALRSRYRRTEQRGLEARSRKAPVHDLDSFGAIPLESKVEIRGLSAALRWRAAVTASRGNGACRTRSGQAGASLIRGKADSLRPIARRFCAAPHGRRGTARARAARTRAQRPPQHRPARGRDPGADARPAAVCRRHRDHAAAHARARGALGSLVARRDRGAARQSRSRQCAAAVRAAGDGGLAGGIRRAHHRRRSGDRRRLGAASRACVRQLARCRQGARHGACGRGVAHARRSLLDDAHHAFRPSDRSARPRHRRPRRAAAEGCQRRQARTGRADRPPRDTADRGRIAAHADRNAAVAGVDARRHRAADLRQCRLCARGRGEGCRRRRRAAPGTARQRRARQHRASARRKRLLCGPAARRGRRRPAQLRRARFPHRHRQRRHRHRRHRSRNHAQRARAAWSMRIAARSISFPPASPCSTPISG